jgi:hypothetical protein
LGVKGSIVVGVSVEGGVVGGAGRSEEALVVEVEGVVGAR